MRANSERGMRTLPENVLQAITNEESSESYPQSRRLMQTLPVFVVAGFSVAYAAVSLRMGSLAKPGPGLWPLLVSIVMLAAVIGVIWAERSSTSTPPTFGRDSLRIMGPGLISIGLFIWLFTWVGFVVAAALSLAIWLRYLGRRSLLESVAYSVAATVAFYFLFSEFLNVPFPEGILSNVLGRG